MKLLSCLLNARVPAALSVGALGVVLIASTQQGHAASIYSQGFDTDTAGFTDGGQFGAITRVASGSNGVASLSGGFHAELTSTDSGPTTNFGNYSATYPGAYQAQVSVYIDPAKLGPGGGLTIRSLRTTRATLICVTTVFMSPMMSAPVPCSSMSIMDRPSKCRRILKSARAPSV